MPKVLDLPKHIVEGSTEGLRKVGAKPPERSFDPTLRFGNDSADVAKALEAAGDGGTTSILDAIEKQIAQDEALAARADAGPKGSHFRSRCALSSEALRPPLIRTRSLVHQRRLRRRRRPTICSATSRPGGFGSELPADDVLPDSIDPDPCKSPEQVAHLPGVVVGRTLSRQLAAGVGDCVQITSPTVGISYGTSNRPPVAKQFRVIAVFEAGFDQYDSKLVYTDLFEAQGFYDYGDSVTGVEMKVDDIDHAKRISREIDKMLGNLIYHTMDTGSLNHGLFTALLIQQILISVILALIIVVATFTVIATLIMLVLEKQKEIGDPQGPRCPRQRDFARVSVSRWPHRRRRNHPRARPRLRRLPGARRMGVPAQPEGLFHLETPREHPAHRVRNHGRLRDRHVPR